MSDALSGLKELSHGLGGYFLCEVALSCGNPLDICNDDTIERFKTWFSIVALIPVYEILIARNFVICLAQFTCIELLINLQNDQRLSADGFVNVEPIAIEFGWD